MKTKGYFILAVAFISLIGLVSFVSKVSSSSTCSGDIEYKQGLASLGPYKLIKDYRVSLKKGDPALPPSESFLVSLQSGLKYRLLPVNNSENKKKMILTIYLNEKKSMILATTYTKAIGKHFPIVDFNCKTTGTYCLSIEFEGGEKGCGVGMFSVEN